MLKYQRSIQINKGKFVWTWTPFVVKYIVPAGEKVKHDYFKYSSSVHYSLR